MTSTTIGGELRPWGLNAWEYQLLIWTMFAFTLRCWSVSIIYFFCGGKFWSFNYSYMLILCFWAYSRTNQVERSSTVTLMFCFYIGVGIMIPRTDLWFLICFGSLVLLYIRSLWRMLLMAWRLKKRKNWGTKASILLHSWSSVCHISVLLDDNVFSGYLKKKSWLKCCLSQEWCVCECRAKSAGCLRDWSGGETGLYPCRNQWLQKDWCQAKGKYIFAYVWLLSQVRL